MTTTLPHPQHVQEESEKQSKADHIPRKKAGRPKGAPSTIVNLRIPVDLLAQLDRYIDKRSSRRWFSGCCRSKQHKRVATLLPRCTAGDVRNGVDTARILYNG